MELCRWERAVNINFHFLEQMRTFPPQLICQVDITTVVMLTHHAFSLQPSGLETFFY